MLETTIPSLAMKNFQIEEDNYIISTYKKENGNTNDPQAVSFICQGKHRMVTGLLKKSFSLSAKASWNPVIGGCIMTKPLKTVSDTLNNVLSWSEGKTVQQPWFNRKIYSSTNPLNFNLNVVFYAEDDPIKEVWEPCKALLAFMYPRLAGDEDDGGKMSNYVMKQLINRLGEENKSVKVLGKTFQYGEKITKDTIVGAMTNAMKLYTPPGPTVGYDPKNSEIDKENQGDPVTVQIGQLWNLQGCYIESVEINFVNGWSKDGYPLAADVTVSVTLMDSCYTDSNGELFGFTEFGDNAEGIADIVNKTRDKVWELTADGVTMVEKAVGFYKVLF